MTSYTTPMYLRTLLASACALLAVDALPSVTFAANTPLPTPTISLAGKVMEGEPTASTTVAATGGSGTSTTTFGKGGFGKGGPGGPGGAAPTGATTMSSAKTYVEFVVRNTDRNLPATGLTVNWHVYTKTSGVSGGTSTYTMADVSGSKTIDTIAPNGIETINSDTVEKSSKTVSGGSSSGGGGFGGFGGRPGSGGASTASSTVTLLEGFYIEVLFNNKVIKHSPTDTKDKYDAYVKSHPGS